MLNERYARLDDMAAPDRFVAPPAADDLAYVVLFRRICKRYNIDFTTADPDEREFVMRMTEKALHQKRA